MIALQSAESLEISVTLPEEATMIRFVKMHLDDILTIISATIDGTAISVGAK